MAAVANSVDVPINPFAAIDLDRAGERRDDTEWLRRRETGSKARFLLLDPDARALVAADRNALLHFSAADCARLQLADSPSFLGSNPDGDYFMHRLDASDATRIAAGSAGEFLDLRSAGASLPAFDAGLFAYARGLALWQQRTRFCTACAAPLRFESAGHRARCTNPQCAIDHFPRTDPAIIVIVSHGERCLLGRGPKWPARRYSTLAGFVEPGETLEDAVRREVLEESGVRVGDCTYHSSQPWPFPASIMLGFTAEAEDPHICLGPELAEANWFSVDDIVGGVKSGQLALSSPLSVSYRLIEHWMRQVSGLELSRLTWDDPIFATRR